MKFFQRNKAKKQKQKGSLSQALAEKKSKDAQEKARKRIDKEHFNFYTDRWRQELISLYENQLKKDEKERLVNANDEELLVWIKTKLNDQPSNFAQMRLQAIEQELSLIVRLKKAVTSPNQLSFYYQIACLSEEVEYLLEVMRTFCQKLTQTMDEGIDSAFQKFIDSKMSITNKTPQDILAKASYVKDALSKEEELNHMVSFVYDQVTPAFCLELNKFLAETKRSNDYNPMLTDVSISDRKLPKVYDGDTYKQLAEQMEAFSKGFSRDELKEKLKTRLHDLIEA